MEEKDLWVRLSENLNTSGAGFYPTKTGSEIELLKKLFTKEEAEVYLTLGNKTEPFFVIQERMNMPAEKLKAILDEMDRKGSVMCLPTDPPCYFPSPFLPGFCESAAMIVAHLEKDKEIIELTEEYLNRDETWLKGSICRPIPVMKSVDGDSTVAPYDDIRKIIESADAIAVSPCACDLHHMDCGRDTSDRPLERCFQLGAAAANFAKKHGGRDSSVEEAMAILDECDEAALVCNIAPFESPVYVCTCGKHCYEMRQKRLRGNAGTEAGSNYYSEVDADVCTGCETCVERCPMEAITMSSEGVPEINLDACIGCGLCVTRCPSEALTLKKKDESKITVPSDRHWSGKSGPDIMQELAPYMDKVKMMKM